MARIAFVGLGRMGRGMAGRLLAAGHELSVFNRTAEKALPLVEGGARAAESPADAADGAAAVFVMVSDDTASRSVWLGPDGVLAGRPEPGALAIECSTLSHGWVLELADAAAAGALTLLVGGDDADVEAARPLLDPISGDVLHFGPVGAGTRTS